MMSKRFLFFCACIAMGFARPALASDAPRSHCIVSDAVVTAVYGEPMRGRPVGSACAFVGRGGNIVFLRVQTTADLARGAGARTAGDYFDTYGGIGFHTSPVSGIGERAKFGRPIPQRSEPGALAFLITVQQDTVVTVYAPPSQLLRTEALTLHVFHALP